MVISQVGQRAVGGGDRRAVGPGAAGTLPRSPWWHRRGLAMVRVPAVWPDAVHRPRRELAAFVHLVAERADDGELREIQLPWRVTHATR
jgi:hypothetical protein